MTAFAVAGMITTAQTAPATTASFKQRLMDAVQHVDRLVITPPKYGYPDGPAPDTPLFEIKGHEDILSLVESMEFEPPPEGEGLWTPCLCYGTHRLQFYSGDNFKFLFSFHHWRLLRGGLGCPWFADATLSAKGQEHMFAWFAKRGFPEFQAGWESAGRFESEDKAKIAALAALFPPATHSWFPRLDINGDWSEEKREQSKQLAAMYPDKSRLLLTCWEALGKMVTWSEQYGPSVRGEPGGFVLRCLEAADDDALSRALAELSDHEDRDLWLGAFRHYVSANRRNEKPLSWDEGRVLQLADHYLANGPLAHRWYVIDALDRIGTPGACAILLNIGKQPLTVSGGDTPRDDGHLEPGLFALLQLAKGRNPDARAVIRKKLAEAPPGKARLALEVCMACYEPTHGIGTEHLLFPGEYGQVAELAWSILSAMHSTEVPVELLAAAARSPSYKVSKAAAVKLAAMGLQRLADDKLEEARNAIIDPALSGTAAIDAYTAKLRMAPDTPISDLLQIARGKAWLEIGEYESARRDFASMYRKADYEHAFAAFCLGRYDETQEALSGRYQGKVTSEALQLEGCLHFALGDFQRAADFFSVATLLGDQVEARVFLHTSLLHLHDSSRLLTDDYAPFLGTELIVWPYSAIHFLQGKISEAALIADAEASRPHEKILQMSFSHWLLSAVARANGDTIKERRHLGACLEVKAYTSLAHALALRRKIELDESDRWAAVNSP